MATFTAKPVGNLLRAKSVAIIGASQKGAWPQGIYRNLKGAKFPGGVYLINPNYQELYGDKCYPNLAACPEVPDELLILIPTRAVLGVLEEAAKLGTRSATIYTAGFGEGDDEKGKERAQQMRDLCDKTGMVICGPNCMGSYSVGEGLWTFPTATPLLKKGPVGLIFQSGGSLGNWIKGATERGIGFSLRDFQRQRSEPRPGRLSFVPRRRSRHQSHYADGRGHSPPRRVHGRRRAGAAKRQADS